MIEDYLLIKRLRHGDSYALTRIYEKYKDHLAAIAMCLVNDWSTAEDCLQNVFVELAARARNLEIRSSLKGYLITSTVNQARNHLRSRSRQRILAGNMPEGESPDSNSAVSLEDCEKTNQLLVALGQLPYEQREIITLHLRAGMTFKQIAQQQAESINTIQSRYRYGIEKLRTILGAGGKQ
jgi:RNA polymerase sigma-70 factor (ECF subfamily)